MSSATKKRLGMRRLTTKEIGSFKYNLISALNASPDPFGSALYDLNIGPCLQLAKELSIKINKKITTAHILNKLIAIAIAENPCFNQVVLGSSIYQLEDINITNIITLPGKMYEMTNVIIENPNLKSLEKIQQEFLVKMVSATKQYFANQPSRASMFIIRLCFKTRLFKLVSEKRAFTIAMKKGLSSNIVLSNHEYGGPARFTVVKPIITPMKVPLRIHSSGVKKSPCMENDILTYKDIIQLTTVADHRIIMGFHGYQFAQSIDRISADPEKYL